MKSAFDDETQEVTEWGRWFVYYTMDEIVPTPTEGADGTLGGWLQGHLADQ